MYEKSAILAMLIAATACADNGADDDDDVVTADANPSASDGSALAGPEVVLETTLGTMVVRLDQNEMPITTANFLTYVDSGFYDDTLVHRVVDDWVIHVHGAISMARTSDPDSATSQWFIVDWPASGTPPQPAQLDGQYAAFGVLIEGFDVLEAITQVATGSSGGFDDVPTTEIVVTSARRR